MTDWIISWEQINDQGWVLIRQSGTAFWITSLRHPDVYTTNLNDAIAIAEQLWAQIQWPINTGSNQATTALSQ